MPVAADIDVHPSLAEVRELARHHSVVPLRHTFISDTETPVSAYLRLRGEGLATPSYELIRYAAPRLTPVNPAQLTASKLGPKPAAVMMSTHG